MHMSGLGHKLDALVGRFQCRGLIITGLEGVKIHPLDISIENVLFL